MVCMYAPVHVSHFLKRCLNVENHLFPQGHRCFFWEGGGTHIVCCPTPSNFTMPSINFSVALFASPINVAPSLFFNVWCFKPTQKPTPFISTFLLLSMSTKKIYQKCHSKKPPQCIIKKTTTLKELSSSFPPSFFRNQSVRLSPLTPTRTRHKN